MKKFGVFALVAVGLVASSHAQVGNWSGTVYMPVPNPKEVKDPAQRKVLEDLVQRLKNYRVKMELRADKKMSMDFPPVKIGTRIQPGQSTTGTWSIKGNVITVLLTMNGSQPIPKAQQKPQTMTLSPDKKRIVMTGGEGVRRTTVTFTKA